MTRNNLVARVVWNFSSACCRLADQKVRSTRLDSKVTVQHHCNLEEFNKYLLLFNMSSQCRCKHYNCNICMDVVVSYHVSPFLYFICLFLYVKGNTSWAENKAWVAFAALATEYISPPCRESLLLPSSSSKGKGEEVNAARTSGLVNLVFSYQTGFSSASFRLLINRCSRSCCSKRTDIRSGFEAVSKQHPTHAQQRSYSIHGLSLSLLRQNRVSERKVLLAR